MLIKKNISFTFNLIIKLLIYFFLNIFIFIPIKANIDSTYILQHRLKQIDDFYVCFVQKIYTTNRDFEKISRGELWIKKPNLFHCRIYDPEESLLISDGTTIWFYTPRLNQVTAYKLNTRIVNIDFLKLLLYSSTSIWHTYRITQEQDWFYLKPILSKEKYHKQYQIKINNHGIISNFNIIESSGTQYISYYLFNQCNKSIDINKFQFSIPADTQIDDQR